MTMENPLFEDVFLIETGDSGIIQCHVSFQDVFRGVISLYWDAKEPLPGCNHSSAPGLFDISWIRRSK